jgi:hypothetical protein
VIRVLSSLERQGLIEKFDHHQHVVAYRITELGRKSCRLGYRPTAVRAACNTRGR